MSTRRFPSWLLIQALSIASSEAPSPSSPHKRCRCGGTLLAGSVCDSDPTPPRCGRCDHALSHGLCPHHDSEKFNELVEVDRGQEDG